MFCSMMWPHHKIKSFVPRNPWLLQNKNYSDHDKLWLRSHWLGRFSDQFSKYICILALPAGSGEPASLRVLHMETCWWSQWAYSWMTGWSLWGGSIMLTSFSDFALGLLSDYIRANCTRGATADNVMAWKRACDSLQMGSSRLCCAGKPLTPVLTVCGSRIVTTGRWQDSPHKKCYNH